MFAYYSIFAPIMIMNKLLIDYCKSRMDDSNYKPE